jgi:tetratricopeptide (TPR) repeat protein
MAIPANEHFRMIDRLRHITLIAVFVLLTGLPASDSHAISPFQAAQHFIETGQHTEARRALESELRMRPGNIEARYNLAVLLEEIHHPQQALSLYEENLIYAWHLPSIINLAGILQQQGKTDQARLWLQKATKKIKHEATPWYLLAAMAEKDGKAVTAASLYRHALKTDPLNGFAYLHYADFQSRHGEAGKGLKYAAKASRLLPNCAPCWHKYGDILRMAGQKRRAVEAFQRSLAIQPNSKTRQHLIDTLHSLGEHERAERMQQALNAWYKHQLKE